MALAGILALAVGLSWYYGAYGLARLQMGSLRPDEAVALDAADSYLRSISLEGPSPFVGVTVHGSTAVVWFSELQAGNEPEQFRLVDPTGEPLLPAGWPGIRIDRVEYRDSYSGRELIAADQTR